MKKLWVTFIVLLFLILVGGVFSFYQISLSSVNSRQRQEQMFVISSGESLVSVGRRLTEIGLIRNDRIFLFEVKRMGLATQIEAGDFRLSPAMDLRELILTLTSGNVDVWITIIPGWRAEQVAVELKEKMANFETLWIRTLKEKEGYLFPDSYLIPKTATLEGVLKIIDRNYNRKVTPQIIEEAKIRNLSGNELIILASLVEREAKFINDRYQVAAVLLNRINTNWPLQVDATIQYAVAGNDCLGGVDEDCNWWPEISGSHIRQTESPFNTYVYKGLPPIPICNPSLQSIEAVIKAPLDSPYWYYLSDKEERIHLSRTLEEHEENIKQFLP